jgi:hypothetical protein
MTIVKGIEHDRAVIRGVALSIIRQILEQPDFDKLRSKQARHDWLAPPPLSAFRRLEPWGFGLPTDDGWLFNPYDCTPDVVWPMDVGIISADGSEEGMTLSRTYSVLPKQVRGYAKRFSPFMVRADHAQMDRGKLIRCAGVYVWLAGKWNDAEGRVMWSGSAHKPLREAEFVLPEQDRIQPAIATATALKQRYEWAVALGLEQSPSIRFATDPTGIKDVFRIRDLPDGKDRREALLNWVTQHWRQHRDDPDIEIYVRRHLRGATSFNWRGMNCELLPSQYDVDQRDKAIAERDAMRVAGTDRRGAVRASVST